MLDSAIEITVIGTAIALFLAHGWYLNVKLKNVHEKLDLVLENFEGLRRYLYEVDPQFDDERTTREAALNEESLFSGMDDMALRKRKNEQGRRTLSTPFVSE